MAGIYSNGPFYGSVAYESLNAEMFNNNATNYGCAAAYASLARAERLAPPPTTTGPSGASAWACWTGTASA